MATTTGRKCALSVIPVIILLGLSILLFRPRTRLFEQLQSDTRLMLILKPALKTNESFQCHNMSTTEAQTSKPYKVLLTMVISAPGNKARRDAIRETWKNSYVEQGKQFDVRFVMGTLGVSDKDKEALFAENKKYNDLVLLTDHLESYNNLTRKVLHMFMWADRNVNYSYLLKTDDDSFARLDVIESTLEARSDPRPLYWGLLGQGIWPRKEGKWKEENWDISDKYLPYMFGGGYVLSADLVHRIAVNADGLILYANEDVSVGAWVSLFQKERKNDPEHFASLPSIGCNNNHILSVLHSVDNLKAKHKRLLSGGTYCR